MYVTWKINLTNNKLTIRYIYLVHKYFFLCPITLVYHPNFARDRNVVAHWLAQFILQDFTVWMIGPPW